MTLLIHDPAGIVVILAQADGKPPPQWQFGLTLNTLLAFLVSVSKAFFIFPIAEGLGQLKWMWFNSAHPKPLNDFQIYDDATKGAWGSLRLLTQFKG